MMSQRLRLELVTPERLVLSEEVDEVRVPGTLGELGVLPGPAPLLTSLGTGPLSYYQGSSSHSLAVQDGFAEVLPDRVTVLARIADAPADIDVEAARAALIEAESKLPTATAEEIDDLTGAVRLAATRMEVATTRRS